MGCTCLTSEIIKADEKFVETENISTTIHLTQANRRLFTVLEEYLESSEPSHLTTFE